MEIVEDIAGKYGLARFTKKSIVAPFTLRRQTVKNGAGERVGHQVDLWFVAHGDLDSIRSQDLFAAMMESKDSDPLSDGNLIAEEELTKRGLKIPPAADDTSPPPVAYYRFAGQVLDRVIVEGVIRRISVATDESLIASIALEEAFNQDDVYPNQWRHIGSETPGKAYAGYGGYAKATRLKGSDGALLIELHVVMHEPREWFGGANLLGSKLPIAVQNGVRRFRRTLAKQ